MDPARNLELVMRLAVQDPGMVPLMPRTQTAAAERTAQNLALRERVARELDRPLSKVSVRFAQAYRKTQRDAGAQDWPDNAKTGPTEGTHAVDHLVPDRIINFRPEDLTLVGVVLGKVMDAKISRGYIQFVIQTGPDFAHLLADAVLLSGHSLQITLHEVHKPRGNGDAG